MQKFHRLRALATFNRPCLYYGRTKKKKRTNSSTKLHCLIFMAEIRQWTIGIALYPARPHQKII